LCLNVFPERTLCNEEGQLDKSLPWADFRHVVVLDISKSQTDGGGIHTSDIESKNLFISSTLSR
jgi:hypothetical protein